MFAPCHKMLAMLWDLLFFHLSKVGLFVSTLFFVAASADLLVLLRNTTY